MSVKSVAGQLGGRRARFALSSQSTHPLAGHWSLSDFSRARAPSGALVWSRRSYRRPSRKKSKRKCIENQFPPRAQFLGQVEPRLLVTRGAFITRPRMLLIVLIAIKSNVKRLRPEGLANACSTHPLADVLCRREIKKVLCSGDKGYFSFGCDCTARRSGASACPPNRQRT